MCIIVAVPQNVELPKTSTLKECFQSNPDGAGFMWADGKTVHIRKGFMTWEAFEKALNDELLSGSVGMDSAVVLHFRIATHGKVRPGCCHPFPVSDAREDFRATTFDCRFGVAHNGIIHGRNTSEDWSDSMDFICNVVAPLAKMNPSFMHNEHALDVLKGACRSKLAIIDNAGDLALVGDFIEDDGVFYSNTSYLPVRVNWTSYRDWWDETTTTYEDRPWDDIDKLVENLPWEACQLCTMAHECATWEPECETARVAVEACAYYNGEEESEIAELFTLD